MRGRTSYLLFSEVFYQLSQPDSNFSRPLTPAFLEFFVQKDIFLFIRKIKSCPTTQNDRQKKSYPTSVLAMNFTLLASTQSSMKRANLLNEIRLFEKQFSRPYRTSLHATKLLLDRFLTLFMPVTLDFFFAA